MRWARVSCDRIGAHRSGAPSNWMGVERSAAVRLSVRAAVVVALTNECAWVLSDGRFDERATLFRIRYRCRIGGRYSGSGCTT